MQEMRDECILTFGVELLMTMLLKLKMNQKQRLLQGIKGSVLCGAGASGWMFWKNMDL